MDSKRKKGEGGSSGLVVVTYAKILNPQLIACFVVVRKSKSIRL